MKFLALLFLLAGLTFFTIGSMKFYTEYENARAAQINRNSWQAAVVEQCKPRPTVKWTEAGISASINGLKSVPQRHLP